QLPGQTPISLEVNSGVETLCRNGSELAERARGRSAEKEIGKSVAAGSGCHVGNRALRVGSRESVIAGGRGILPLVEIQDAIVDSELQIVSAARMDEAAPHRP